MLRGLLSQPEFRQPATRIGHTKRHGLLGALPHRSKIREKNIGRSIVRFGILKRSQNHIDIGSPVQVSPMSNQADFALLHGFYQHAARLQMPFAFVVVAARIPPRQDLSDKFGSHRFGHFQTSLTVFEPQARGMLDRAALMRSTQNRGFP